MFLTSKKNQTEMPEQQAKNIVAARGKLEAIALS
jgi:hypothetical protein